MISDSGMNESGVVKSIAFRFAEGNALCETKQCRVLVSRGLERENRPPGRRNVTLLSVAGWADACRDLGTQLPWYTRRANLLVEGLKLVSTIGRAVLIGEVRLWIHDETKPCQLMEQQYPGLRAALQPECRGGVFGQVLSEGMIRVGDEVRLAPRTSGDSVTVSARPDADVKRTAAP